jgi:DNA-3-methyladenine glycosylase II
MTEKFEIFLKPPFSFELSMGVWLRHPQEQIDVIRDGKYSRLFFVEGNHVLLTIENIGTVDQPACSVSIQGESFPGAEKWARQTALHILNDQADIQDFYQHLEKSDPELLRETAFLKGLKPVQTPTLFETLVFAIVGQQVNVRFAYQCRVAMENLYSRKAEFHGETRVASLAPEDLENVEVDDLRQLKISRNKGKSILKLARAFRQGDIAETAAFKALSEEEVDQKLLAQFGVGPWTVEYAKIRALGFNDSWPIGDAGLRAALEKFYGKQKRLSPEEIRELGTKWRPFRSWATYYLWTWLGQAEKNKKKQ